MAFIIKLPQYPKNDWNNKRNLLFFWHTIRIRVVKLILFKTRLIFAEHLKIIVLFNIKKKP